MWRDVTGYEGLYQVNEQGEVKSVARMKPNNSGHQLVNERLLAQVPDKDGYLRVCLSKDGKHAPALVSRLVAREFIPNPDELPVVNHKDENKQNNNSDNLEWCTVRYNTCYGTGLERTAMKNGRPVVQIKNDEVVGEYYSTGNASTRTGIPQGNIYKVCVGERKSAGGYQWRFKND